MKLWHIVNVTFFVGIPIEASSPDAGVSLLLIIYHRGKVLSVFLITAYAAEIIASNVLTLTGLLWEFSLQA